MNHRRLQLVTVLVALTFCTIFTFSSVSAVQPPVAKILSVDYPRHVLSGGTFSITVHSDYSDKVGVDVGIWDVQTGIIQSISVPLRKIGEAGFTFNLTAPASKMDWRLLAITRIWWQDAWYQDPVQGSWAFTISVSDTVTVLLNSSEAASLKFDGSQYSMNNNNPASLNVKPGVYRLEALPVIQSKVGRRSVFLGWSDGINSSSRQIVVGGDVNITALYRTEYYLSVKSDRGRATGDGWYPEGSTATFAVVPASETSSQFGLFSENYRFAGWSVDSNSSLTLASVTMNGPKMVETKWISRGITINPAMIANAMLIGSVILIGRGIYRHSRRRVMRQTFRGLRRWAKLIALASVLCLSLIQIPPAYAQLPAESRRSIVKIGDAAWYYWNNPTSDTCLLWLGGGTTQERDPAHYSYNINPFQYESFGTIRFMQELARYYCVIALEMGSSELYNPAANRSLYQEPYSMDSRIISDVHGWIRNQGYAHILLVGYSTGAQVAAMEVALRAPEEWVSPDGLILITPRLSDTVSASSYRIRASLLVLYGGSIETPAYISTGRAFYDNAPQEGWQNNYCLHKEFRMIEKMGHEVWTIYDTGSYDPQALRIIVNFIDTARSLQFTPHDLTMIMHATDGATVPNPLLTLTSVQAPHQTLTTNIMRIEATFKYNVQNSTATRLLALNTEHGKIENAAEFTLAGKGERIVNLNLLSPSNSSEFSLEIILLTDTGEGWQLAEKPLFTKTYVTEGIRVTMASTIPNMPFMFDGVPFKTGGNSIFEIDTTPGEHVLQVQPLTYPTTSARITFTGWEDGSTQTNRRVILNNNTRLLANYRMQYSVNVTSPYGEASGSGWYDENAPASITVNPPLVNEQAMIFTHWTGDASSTELRYTLTVNSPKTVSAAWSPTFTNARMEPASLLLLSIALFAFALLWNIKLSRKSFVS